MVQLVMFCRSKFTWDLGFLLQTYSKSVAKTLALLALIDLLLGLRSIFSDIFLQVSTHLIKILLGLKTSQYTCYLLKEVLNY